MGIPSKSGIYTLALNVLNVYLMRFHARMYDLVPAESRRLSERLATRLKGADIL